MNFRQDITDYIKGEFAYLNVNYTPTSDLDSDLLKLFTVQKKIVFPFPRKVEISNELQLKIDNKHKFRYSIQKLKTKLELGMNVNPHLSRNLLNYHVHDDLVYDWRIYHFHLSFERIKNEYFTERTKEVLFVYITKERALLLDVLPHPPHDVFANKTLLEIIDNNWSDILLVANNVVGLSHNATQQERFKLRKYNINEGIIEVNGKFVFAPGLGQASSGDSVEEVMKLNQLRRWLESNEKNIIKNKDEVDKMFMNLHKLDYPPKYKIVFTEQGPQIWDSNSNKCLVEYNQEIQLNQSTTR